jgi:Zn-dependent M28 family amino/carboxypeptidase
VNDGSKPAIVAAGRGKRLASAVRWGVVLLVVLAVGRFMTGMPGSSWSGPLPPLDDREQLVRDNLKRHVAELAGRIGERNVWRPGTMDAAAGYIRTTLETAGYAVKLQPFTSRGQTVNNIEAVLPGRERADEIIVAGAHYDSVEGTPGANDNASGVAALLELARLLAGTELSRTVRFVAFANEEAPFFYGDEMGSNLYAARARAQDERIEAMLSLETIGYYTDRPGSQSYPFPFNLFYPNTGNFIGFVGDLSSWRLVRRATGAFRAATAFPSEGVAAPRATKGVHWSDHWSFWEAGYPAIMVTDTALYRYPHYHKATDTPEQLDYTGLARVTGGLADVITALASD